MQALPPPVLLLAQWLRIQRPAAISAAATIVAHLLPRHLHHHRLLPRRLQRRLCLLEPRLLLLPPLSRRAILRRPHLRPLHHAGVAHLHRHANMSAMVPPPQLLQRHPPRCLVPQSLLPLPLRLLLRARGWLSTASARLPSTLHTAWEAVPALAEAAARTVDVQRWSRCSKRTICPLA